MLKPEQPIPDLAFDLIDGSRWTFDAGPQTALTMLSIYRGAFCRFCRAHLLELEALAEKFAALGIPVVAASVDPAEVAAAMAAELGLQHIRVGHGLDPAFLAENGVFVSEVTRDGELRRFAEPSLWLVRPDRRLYAVFQGSMSCARPDLGSLLERIEMLAPHGFPARGNI